MSNIAMQKAPFFIVGCGRSGTTLLQTLIDSQPSIAIPSESYIYIRFGPIFHTYGDLKIQRNRLKLIDEMLRDSFISRWHLGVAAEDIDQRLPRQTRGGIIETLFAVYAESRGATRWGDKTPEHIRHLNEIRLDFPDAKFIHLVRDGRDVAEAMRRMIWCPVSAVGLGRKWRHEVMHWQTFCQSAGSADTLVVRYEDLVTNPQEVVEDVLHFIGEPFTDTISTYMDSPLSQSLGALGPWHSSLRQGISSDKVGIYRKQFTAREIEIFESIAGDALVEYGYQTDYTSPRAPTLFDRLSAKGIDPVVRWYRKLHHAHVFWLELQFRLRIAYRLLRGAPRG